MTKRPDVNDPKMYRLGEGSEQGFSFSLEQAFQGLPISWDCLRDDPLITLLNHSDCDGEIAASDCGPLADRLAELLPQLPDGKDWGHIGDWRVKTQTFIEGLRAAAAAGEAVRFH